MRCATRTPGGEAACSDPSVGCARTGEFPAWGRALARVSIAQVPGLAALLANVARIVASGSCGFLALGLLLMLFVVVGALGYGGGITLGNCTN